MFEYAKTAIRPWVPAPLRTFRRNGFRSTLSTSAVPEQEPWAKMQQEAEQIAQSGKPIVAGPWLSEVGFEVLYWIPFLNWFCSYYQVSRDRITVISRGGNRSWYRNIASHYIDIFDYFAPEEFKERNLQRWQRQRGKQKQIRVDVFDEEVLAHARPRLYGGEFSLLHPSTMYQMFRPSWSLHHGLQRILDHTEFKPFPVLETTAATLEKLPERYVAAKFYFSECFPDTELNRQIVRELLRVLARKTPVVILDTGLNLDDHSDWRESNLTNLFSLKEAINPRNNLELQTQVVSQASAFFGTYGGFSYLAPFYGVSSLSFYSQPTFLQVHLDVAHRAFAKQKRGSFTVLDTGNMDLVQQIFA